MGFARKLDTFLHAHRSEYHATVAKRKPTQREARRRRRDVEVYGDGLQACGRGDTETSGALQSNRVCFKRSGSR